MELKWKAFSFASRQHLGLRWATREEFAARAAGVAQKLATRRALAVMGFTVTCD